MCIHIRIHVYIDDICDIYIYIITYVHTCAQEMALQKSSILVGGWPFFIHGLDSLDHSTESYSVDHKIRCFSRTRKHLQYWIQP